MSDVDNAGRDPSSGEDANQTAAPMRLRGEPPRVTRLSRRAITALGLVAGLGLGAALIYALQTRDDGRTGEELYSTTNRPTADGLAGLPRDYTGPRLGPPLPGDLGRPILDAQNRGQPVVPPTIQPTVDPDEQRRLAEEEAARTSRVFFQTEAQPVVAPGGVAGPANLAGFGLPGQITPPTAQDRQIAFLNAGVDRRTVAPDRVMAPASPYILQAGSVIPAALITGIRSDLPGQITAQVTESIYDSPTGRLLLVPQGTRIIGQYDNAVQFGQRRILLVWNRLIFPNGRSSVSPVPIRKAMPVSRTGSTIIGGIWRRRRACRRCSALARSLPSATKIGCCRRSGTVARIRSMTPASRLSGVSSTSRRH